MVASPRPAWLRQASAALYCGRPGRFARDMEDSHAPGAVRSCHRRRYPRRRASRSVLVTPYETRLHAATRCAWITSRPAAAASRPSRSTASSTTDPGPGSRTSLVDETNLGKYVFEVIDRGTNRVIYSRGFASLYGEWETTPDAREIHRTFSGDAALPMAAAAVQMVLKKRDRLNAFHEFWSAIIDPASRQVNRARLAPAGKVLTLWESGPPESNVDLLLSATGTRRRRWRIPGRRAAARRPDVRARAVQEPSRRLQRAGDRDANRGKRRAQPQDRRDAPHAAGHGVQRLRQRARRPRPGQPRVARHRLLRPVRCRGDLINDRHDGGAASSTTTWRSPWTAGSAHGHLAHEFGHHFVGPATSTTTPRKSPTRRVRPKT